MRGWGLDSPLAMEILSVVLRHKYLPWSGVKVTLGVGLRSPLEWGRARVMVRVRARGGILAVHNPV